MSRSSEGWTLVWALTAIGIASGLDAEDALERATAWLVAHQGEEPSDESAREAFDLMRAP